MVRPHAPAFLWAVLLSKRMAEVHVEMHFEMKSLCSYFKHFVREVHVKTIADGRFFRVQCNLNERPRTHLLI